MLLSINDISNIYLRRNFPEQRTKRVINTTFIPHYYLLSHYLKLQSSSLDSLMHPRRMPCSERVELYAGETDIRTIQPVQNEYPRHRRIFKFHLNGYRLHLK